MLSPSQEAKVKDFASSKDQKEAVKQFILDSFSPENWLDNISTSLDDQVYGQAVKAVVKAKNLVEVAFEEMDSLIEPPKPTEKTNQAR